MIYIWDNGENYDCHSIRFVETEWNEEIVTAAMQTRDPSGAIIGKAERIDWTGGVSASPLDEFFWDVRELDKAALPDSLIRAVAERRKTALLEAKASGRYGDHVNVELTEIETILEKVK